MEVRNASKEMLARKVPWPNNIAKEIITALDNIFYSIKKSDKFPKYDL